MKNTKRILCATLALVLVLSVMLTGCDRLKPTFNKIPGVAATYGDGQELTTGQYLAYLSLTIDNVYQEKLYELNPYYQYTGITQDPWAQTYTYGDSSEQISLSDYIILSTKDTIKRQIVLTQMMKDNNLKWIADDEAAFNSDMVGLPKDAFIKLGFNNESYIYAMRNMQLNERSTFYGLYGKDGPRAIAETELKKYYEDNYLSYKMIYIALTDSNGKELDKEGEAYQKIMDAMNKYLETYEKEGFDAAYELYEKEQDSITDLKKTEATKTTATSATGSTGSATSGTGSTTGSTAGSTTAATESTTTTSATSTTGSETSGTGSTTGSTTGTGTATVEKEEEHNHEHRQNVDASTMDEELKKAIEGVKVGECKLTEMTVSSTPYIAMIERLDINKDDEGKEGTIYESEIENIIYTLKGEDFIAEVDALVAELKVDFNDKVINYKDCKPEKLYEIMETMTY